MDTNFGKHKGYDYDPGDPPKMFINNFTIGVAGEDIKKGDIVRIDMNQLGNQIIYKVRSKDINDN
jgi:hypothetical protein